MQYYWRVEIQVLHPLRLYRGVGLLLQCFTKDEEERGNIG